MEDRREIEWQFEVPHPDHLASWLEAERERLRPLGSRRITDLYLDTADWRLYRAGYALRLRSAGGKVEATMKSLAARGENGLRERREISEPLPKADVRLIPEGSGPVGRRVRVLAGRRSLRVLFRVETDRTSCAVLLAGRRAATVELDSSEIRAGTGGRLLRRVEVEAEPGVPAGELEDFVRELRETCGLSPAALSKYEAGLRVAGLSPPGLPELGPEGTGHSPVLGELAFAVMRSQMRRFLAHEPGARLGEDPEELHDLRVACRRLRTALRVFREALPEGAARFRGELGWIGGVLGEVRDLDVLLAREGELPDGLQRALERDREEARDRMLQALDSRRYRCFVEEFAGFLRRGDRGHAPGADRPVLEAAPELVAREHRRARKAGARIGPGSPAEDYHRLRRRVRGLRYTLEFFSGLYGAAAREYVSALKGLQDLLGEHQDATVAAGTLRRLARRFSAAENLARLREERACELQGLLPGRYPEMEGPLWGRLREEMERRRAKPEGHERG
ncbi:hypothetical protein Rxycam_01800 [Rubrobacter xylanophilus DSM 9941]|uniref:CYTH and CHAD domain-containing protein n=1 Tax=Rubrobacter xylanophilus TaxID=49319 RepID=UPI001C63F8F7|nr:CHAD domain-containing protein [Rubrobacter xylanophilus]QYJ15970.1 hypothetical protein Rxycam_01800 [Rubrobacter xylanophilus DSM 9941]